MPLLARVHREEASSALILLSTFYVPSIAFCTIFTLQDDTSTHHLVLHFHHNLFSIGGRSRSSKAITHEKRRAYFNFPRYDPPRHQRARPTWIPLSPSRSMDWSDIYLSTLFPSSPYNLCQFWNAPSPHLSFRPFEPSPSSSTSILFAVISWTKLLRLFFRVVSLLRCCLGLYFSVVLPIWGIAFFYLPVVSSAVSLSSSIIESPAVEIADG